MQLDADTAAVIGIFSSFASATIGYGIMREKVRRLEQDLHELKDGQKEYVTFHHFDAVIEPIKRTLELVQKDVKEILRAVSTPNRPKG